MQNTLVNACYQEVYNRYIVAINISSHFSLIHSSSGQKGYIFKMESSKSSTKQLIMITGTSLSPVHSWQQDDLIFHRQTFKKNYKSCFTEGKSPRTSTKLIQKHNVICYWLSQSLNKQSWNIFHPHVWNTLLICHEMRFLFTQDRIWINNNECHIDWQFYVICCYGNQCVYQKVTLAINVLIPSLMGEIDHDLGVISSHQTTCCPVLYTN